MKFNLQNKILPLSLTAFIVALDQWTKALVVEHVPRGHQAFHFFGDFLIITHQRNKGAAFSLGADLPEVFRIFFLVVLPIIGLGLLFIYYWRSKELSMLQRWLFAGILGGGIGNILIDRIFRPEGVVDFISVKFYGLFRMTRFPTFNVADASIVVAVILLISSLIVSQEARKEKKPETHQ